jgi:undecaprenyl-diphosphatase
VPLVHALILGITQGLSEYLPISSSGHLRLVPWLFGWDDFAGHPDLELAFDVSLHLGTLVGAVTYFRRDLVRLARGGLLVLRTRRTPARVGAVETSVTPVPEGTPEVTGALGATPADEGRLAWLLLLSAVPAAILGAALESTFNELGQTEWLIGVFLIVFGLVLLWADNLGGRRGADGFRLRDALTLGSAQALALAPGVSRSGATITAARWRGFSRDAAARISFLMSLPITGGAVAFEMFDMFREGGVPEGFGGALVVGILASAVTGWVAVWGTLRLVRTRTFTPFVIYRVVVGTAVILVAALGLR